MTGFNRDFCFVEFFKPEDGARAIQLARDDELKVQGQPVFLTWGKSKHDPNIDEKLPAGTPAAYQDNPSEISKHVYGIGRIGAQQLSDSLPPIIQITKQKSKKKELSEYEKRQKELERWQSNQKRLERINQQISKIDSGAHKLASLPDVKKIEERNPSKKEWHVCLVCRVKFSSVRGYEKHVKKSEKHSKNKEKA